MLRNSICFGFFFNRINMFRRKNSMKTVNTPLRWVWQVSNWCFMAGMPKNMDYIRLKQFQIHVSIKLTMLFTSLHWNYLLLAKNKQITLNVSSFSQYFKNHCFPRRFVHKKRWQRVALSLYPWTNLSRLFCFVFLFVLLIHRKNQYMQFLLHDIGFPTFHLSFI